MTRLPTFLGKALLTRGTIEGLLRRLGGYVTPKVRTRFKFLSAKRAGKSGILGMLSLHVSRKIALA